MEDLAKEKPTFFLHRIHREKYLSAWLKGKISKSLLGLVIPDHLAVPIQCPFVMTHDKFQEAAGKRRSFGNLASL
jgi:hypothetical protein